MTDFIARRTMMVDNQVRPSDVTKFPIIEAMLSIQREYFVPASLREASYMDGNVSLGEGRVLFEPRTFAKMLMRSILELTNWFSMSDLALDIHHPLLHTWRKRL